MHLNPGFVTSRFVCLAKILGALRSPLYWQKKMIILPSHFPDIIEGHIDLHKTLVVSLEVFGGRSCQMMLLYVHSSLSHQPRIPRQKQVFYPVKPMCNPIMKAGYREKVGSP